MAQLTVLRVFCDAQGEHGNPLGVFLEGSSVPESERQAVALDLGFSETVFVDDRVSGRIAIYTPEVELPFAGHPSVGTAWLLGETGERPAVLRPPAGDLAIRFEGDLAWVSARAEWAPPFAYRQFASPAEVEALSVLEEEIFCWAWADEAAGTVRARCFVPEVGVAEDEATGSATLALCARLDREIEVAQGAGSQLFARPLGGGAAEVGGRVRLDERRDYVLSA